MRAHTAARTARRRWSFCTRGWARSRCGRTFPRAWRDATALPRAGLFAARLRALVAGCAAARARYMHDEALTVLPALLDRLGIDDPILIGHSDGASIALIHAGSGKRPVRALVALAPHVFVEDMSIASIAEARTAIRDDRPARTGSRAATPIPTPRFAAGTTSGSHRRFATGTSKRACRRALPAAADPGPRRRIRQRSAARRDRAPGRRQVARLELADCRHSPHRDQPEATLAAIADFVATVRLTAFCRASARWYRRLRGRAGLRDRDPHRLRQRQLGEQRLEQGVVLVASSSARVVVRRGDDQHELAARPVGVGREPGGRLGQRAAMQRFETLGQLARDDDLALRIERGGERRDRRRDPVRRFVEDQRVRQRAHALELRRGARRLRRAGIRGTATAAPRCPPPKAPPSPPTDRDRHDRKARRPRPRAPARRPDR